MSVEKTVGDEVFAGTINGYGAIRIEIHQPPESSLIQRVIRLEEQAQTERPPSQQLIEKFERSYAKAIAMKGPIVPVPKTSSPEIKRNVKNIAMSDL